MRSVVFGLLFVGLSGCAAASLVVPLALDAVLGGVGIYQRYQDRQVQNDQNEELAKLRAEIERLRLSGAEGMSDF